MTKSSESRTLLDLFLSSSAFPLKPFYSSALLFIEHIVHHIHFCHKVKACGLVESVTKTRAKTLYLKEFRLRNGSKVSGNFPPPPQPSFSLLGLWHIPPALPQHSVIKDPNYKATSCCLFLSAFQYLPPLLLHTLLQLLHLQSSNLQSIPQSSKLLPNLVV